MIDAGLVIFDLDGTLFRGDPATVAAVWEVFDEFEIDRPTREEIVAFFGIPTAQFQEWLASLGGDGRGAEAARQVIRREVKMVADKGELFDGARAALETLSSVGRKIALCTNGDEPYVSTVLESQRIREFFDMIRLRERAGDHKPAMAAEILAAIDARPFAVVGDRADDIAAANENGGFAIGVTYGYGKRTELEAAAPDVLLDSPEQIAATVTRLFG